MTLAELKTQLATSGYTVAYDYFPAENCPELPIVTYSQTGTENFFADGSVYATYAKIEVNLLTAGKNLTAERALKTAMAGLAWEQTETDVYDEHCLINTYEFLILLTEE